MRFMSKCEAKKFVQAKWLRMSDAERAQNEASTRLAYHLLNEIDFPAPDKYQSIQGWIANCPRIPMVGASIPTLDTRIAPPMSAMGADKSKR